MIFKKGDEVMFTEEALDRSDSDPMDAAILQPVGRRPMTVSSVDKERDDVFTEELGAVPINPRALEKVPV